MMQDEKWLIKYLEVMDFIKTNKRNPSRHRIEEHDMLNWIKANRKLVNAGKMKFNSSYGGSCCCCVEGSVTAPG